MTNKPYQSFLSWFKPVFCGLDLFSRCYVVSVFMFERLKWGYAPCWMSVASHDQTEK